MIFYNLVSMEQIQGKIGLLKDYFARRDDVVMAFVFGSYASGHEVLESDFDLAVYFIHGMEGIGKEDEIWSDVSGIVKKEIDLVCLNNAPASLISDVIKRGISLVIKDEKLYWDIYLRMSMEAEDFLEFANDYFKIYKMAQSLTPEQKVRLLERLQFLNEEMKEIEGFKKLTFDEYKTDKTKRRNIERWAENNINASIDIAKIILASEKKMMPKTYEEALRDFGILVGLDEEDSRKFSRFANLRNILAHEYLEILYERLKNFIEGFPPLSKKITDFLDKYSSDS